jgi:heme/copper-type cytochrome/quinol oxidase subunit 2
MDRRTLLWLQGAYYIASGSLALVSMPLFEKITGLKRDRWLVQMVALLAVTIGVSCTMFQCVFAFRGVKKCGSVTLGSRPEDSVALDLGESGCR